MLSNRLEFDTLNNTRDLGGIVNKDNKVIKCGKLLRSGKLYNISDSDAKKLSEITECVVDLRSKKECERESDPDIDGICFYNIPVLENVTDGITKEKSNLDIKEFMSDPDNAKAYMINTYRTFAKNEYTVNKYAEFMKLLLEDRQKAVLWHCTAGKDRTGIATAILLEILNVDRSTIIQDYLKTNDYIGEDYEELKKFNKIHFKLDDDVNDMTHRYLICTMKEYLEAYYETIDEIYGSFDNFIKEGLHIEKKEIDMYHKLYLN